MSQYICYVEIKCLWYELGLHGLVVAPRVMVLTVVAHHETLAVVALCCVVGAEVQILQQWPLVEQKAEQAWQSLLLSAASEVHFKGSPDLAFSRAWELP